MLATVDSEQARVLFSEFGFMVLMSCCLTLDRFPEDLQVSFCFDAFVLLLLVGPLPSHPFWPDA